MRTHLHAQKMMAWMSWWERRKAFRVTTTPATWIQPSSGQYSLGVRVNTFLSTVYEICFIALCAL